MKWAYYNENDPAKVEWLDALMRQGVIAYGEIDGRSIKDVQKEDLRGFRQCHFFAGIGIWSYALRQAGWPDDRPVWTGSCPCQPFSVAGQRGGAGDLRHLWPDWAKLIRAASPACVFGEQVSSTDGRAWFDDVRADLENALYQTWGVDTCAAGYGAPHIRQRLYFVAERVADTSSQRRDRREGAEDRDVHDGPDAGRPQGDAGSISSGQAGVLGLEHTQSHGRIERGTESGGRGAVGGRSHGRLGDPSSPGLPAPEHETLRRSGRGPQGGATSQSGIPSGRLADPGSVGRQQIPTPETQSRGPGLIDDSQLGRPGPVNSFWGLADWLLCTDGKWRPVSAQPFTLADGPPADLGYVRDPDTGAFYSFPLQRGNTNRVMRLRGYGDGIVAPAAIAFVESYMELLADLGKA